MLAIDSLSAEESLNVSWQPVERHFKAERDSFSCSFVVGFPYLYSNGNAVKLSTPTAFEDGIVWSPANETVEIFSKAFSKNYRIDSAGSRLISEKISPAKIPAKDSAQTKPASAEKNSVTAAKTSAPADKNVSPAKENSTPETKALASAEKNPAAKDPAAKAQEPEPLPKPEKSEKPVKDDRKAPAGSRRVLNIVIDPGHGGKDPGAIGKISNEKDIVLSVAKLLAKELKDRGFQVKLTRDTDKFIQLSERPQIANRWNGDLFISLHCNAIDGPRKEKAKGFRIYVLRDPESEEDRAIARRENKVASIYGDKNSKDELSPLDWLKIQARLEQYKQASYTFTEKVIASYEGGKISKMGSGAGGAGFMVLVGAFMPATLVELGFISNPEEERYMNSDKGQRDMARRIAIGVSEYRKAIDEYLKTLVH